MIFKSNDKFLAALAVRNNMDLEKVVSAYLIMGEQFQLLLHVFEGCDIHVPSKRRLGSPSLHNIFFIEDDEGKFSDYERNNILEYDGKEYIVVSKERSFLNHKYIPVLPQENTGGES